MANYTNRRQSDLPIRCDTCHYRYGTGKHSMCQYILLAGVSRDCPADENCTKYINKKRKKEKGKMASKINWTPKLDAEVDQLRADGWEWEKIGERLGCTGKAASVRYYKRRKPVHTPAAETPEPQPTASVVAAEPKPTEPAEAEPPKDCINNAEYPALLHTWAERLYFDTYKTDKRDDTARTLMFGAADRYERLLDDYASLYDSTAREYIIKRAELHAIHGDLDLHAEHIATLAGLLRLVYNDAGSSKENYDALMTPLDILLDSLTEATKTLGAVAERLGKEIKNQPQSGNSTAD